MSDLSKPFGKEAIRQKRGQGNRMMDYVSHGMVTKRLNDAAPDWTAVMVERYIQEQNGQLHCLGGVMQMTIGGVTREEAGGPARLGALADDLKNTYSDCIKRCAMRFGVALDLWESAEENDEDAQGESEPPCKAEPRRDTSLTNSAQAPPVPPGRAEVTITEVPTLEPMTTDDMNKLFLDATEMVQRGDDSATVLKFMRADRNRMDEEQRKAANGVWQSLKEEIENREAVAAEG